MPTRPPFSQASPPIKKQGPESTKLNHCIKRSGSGSAPAVTSTAAQHICSYLWGGEVSHTQGLTQPHFLVPNAIHITVTAELKVTAPSWAPTLLLM